MLLLDALALTSGLGLADEVVLLSSVLVESRGILPFLVVLGTLVGGSCFLETKTLQPLLSLLFEVGGVGNAGVLRLWLGFGDRLVRNLSIFGVGLLPVCLSISFTSFFGLLFAFAGFCAPSSISLLLVFVSASSIASVTTSSWTSRASTTSLNAGVPTLDRIVSVSVLCESVTIGSVSTIGAITEALLTVVEATSSSLIITSSWSTIGPLRLRRIAFSTSRESLFDGLDWWFRLSIGVLVWIIAQELVKVLALDVRHDAEKSAFL